MSEDTRLPAGLWIEAQLRQLTVQAIPYYIVNKGAYYSGTVLLKLNMLENGCKILTQIRDLNGQLGWFSALKEETVAEAEADAYIRRAVERDPDVWVIEIEDRQGQNPFAGKIITE